MLLFIVLEVEQHIQKIDFNTSHVTVYQDVLASERLVMWFQYISCYCLSKYNVCQTVRHVNFNTSHVTVYRGDVAANLQKQIKFQYISCYCLSSEHVRCLCGLYNFNTSHVTVYRVRPWFHRNFQNISIHLMLLFIMYLFGVSVMSL